MECTLGAAAVVCSGPAFHDTLHTFLGLRSLWDLYEDSEHANETMGAHHLAQCRSPYYSVLTHSCVKKRSLSLLFHFGFVLQ